MKITDSMFLPKEELHKYQKEGMKILAFTNHEDDEYVYPDGKLTIYASHVEGLSRVEDGIHVLIFGGEYHEMGEYGDTLGYIPNWWFLNGSNSEIAANPIKFIPLENI